MNLKRQLLLVSLLTLVLPWAGCEFIRETEIALREGQQQMLSGTAQAIADSLSQFPDEFLAYRQDAGYGAAQLYAHPLAREPLLDGYFDDWSIGTDSQLEIRGADGSIRFALGTIRRQLWVYLEVRDSEVVYAGQRGAAEPERVTLVSSDAAGEPLTIQFVAEAPGGIVARLAGGASEPRIAAHWQDVPGGYRLEARVPRSLLGPILGLTVDNAGSGRAPVRSATFGGPRPGRLVTPSPFLQSVLGNYVQPGLRLIVTDVNGWQLAVAGGMAGGSRGGAGEHPGWLRFAYDAILEPGEATELAEPDPSGRERAPYIATALAGRPASAWFRTAETGRAVVAVAQPIWSGNVRTGTVILQQGTEAILSLTSAALTRLVTFTLIATLVAAGALLGYATWLSQRVRRLSRGARRALGDSRAHADLPSLSAGDEIGDLSRSFASVLKQLGEYNDYLRSLASKLSHELRTPLTVVRSSLDNLEHEDLPEEARRYAGRARDGVERLKNILNAMSEANRVEELIESAEAEDFDLDRVLAGALAGYADAWPARRFGYERDVDSGQMRGAPELIVQLLDKLVDNAVDFSAAGDEIRVSLSGDDSALVVAVTNPGPPLPEKMRGQLFDSMISLRPDGADSHLGLGLYIARLIAEGHGGGIRADNIAGGVRFAVTLSRG